MHNTSGQVRVAAQNRWVPWWLSTNIGGGSTGYLSREELEALPAELQPLMRESHAHPPFRVGRSRATSLKLTAARNH